MMMNYKNTKYPFLTIIIMFVVLTCIIWIPLIIVLFLLKIFGVMIITWLIVFLPIVIILGLIFIGYMLDLIYKKIKNG